MSSIEAAREIARHLVGQVANLYRTGSHGQTTMLHQDDVEAHINEILETKGDFADWLAHHTLEMLYHMTTKITASTFHEYEPECIEILAANINLWLVRNPHGFKIRVFDRDISHGD